MNADTLTVLFGALNASGVRYVVVGGLAVMYWGYVRATQDVDLVLAMDDANVRAALRVFEELGYQPRVPVALDDFADPGRRAEWAAQRNMVVFPLHSERYRSMPIDLFLSAPVDVDEELAAAVLGEIAPGITMPIVRYESLRRLKVEAGRPVDLADLERLAKVREDRP